MCLVLTNCLVIFITWDHRLVSGPFAKEVSSRGESESEKDDRHAFFTAINPMDTSVLPLRYEPNEPRNMPYKLKW